MPLKSWAIRHFGHAFRTEIWWQYTGWSRQRLYIDHTLVAQRSGFLKFGSPLVGHVPESDLDVEASFGPRRLGCDMACRLQTRRELLELTEARIEKKWAHSAEDDGTSGVTFGMLFGCLVGMPLLFIAAALYLPGAMVIGILDNRQHRRLRKRLQGQGRLIEWAVAENRMKQGPSTLIVQTGPKFPFRTWWTKDDVLDKTPFLPTVRTTRRFPSEIDPPTPFDAWCWCHYISEESGTAQLIENSLDVLDQVDFFDSDKPVEWKSKYPELTVIEIEFVDTDRHGSVKRFLDLMGDQRACFVSSLVAAIDDEDEFVRLLAIHGLKTLGESASVAVPRLVNQLHYGPWGERYIVASTLAALGPHGEAALQEASKAGDPWIREPAASELEQQAFLTT